MRHSVVLVTVIVVCRTPTASVGAHMPTCSGEQVSCENPFAWPGCLWPNFQKSSAPTVPTFAMPTLVSATPNYVRPQRCISCGGEAGRLIHTLFKRPASNPDAVAAASLTDIHKLTPFGGGGFVGRLPCALDQWFIRFRLRQWLTTWTFLS